MPVLPNELIAAFASRGGFSEADLPTAVAIALAESSGNSGAHNNNKNTGDDSYGLWQINMLGALGPNRRKQFGIAANLQLLDPLVNARAAKMVKNEAGWKAWSTYKRGSHTKHMAAGHQAVKDMHTKGAKWAKDATDKHAQYGNEKVSGDGTQKPVGEGGDGTQTDNGLFGINGAIREGVGAFTKTVETFALNFGAMMLAGLLLVLGVVILLRSPIGSVVSKGTPVGKAASLARKVG